MIYFDNSATTQVAPEVLQTYNTVSQKIWGNPSSLHNFGEEAWNLLEQARQQIANLFHVNPVEIVFTSGGSEGDNWVIKGTAMAKRRFGKHIITTSVEHAAVRNPIEQLRELGFDVTYLPVDKEGRINPADLKVAIRPDTILVSVMAVNNEIGTIQPIKEVGEILKDYPNIHFHVDAVQAIGKGIDDLVFSDRVDFATFSGHKFHAPRGTGFVYVKSGRKLEPLVAGGGQEHGLRSGTENTPGDVALARAIRLVKENEAAAVKREQAIKERIYDHIKQFDHVKIFSGRDEGFAPHVLCFAIVGVRGETIVHAFEDRDIYISTTSACSSKKSAEAGTLAAMKVPENEATSAVRISLGDQNTLKEADEFNKTFDQLYNGFKKIIEQEGGIGVDYTEIMVRYGELSTKGHNKKNFIDRLGSNVRKALHKFDQVKVHAQRDRLHVELNGADYNQVMDRLKDVFGIQNFSPSIRVDKTFEATAAAAEQMIREQVKKPIKFKINTRRSDHKFPIDTFEMNDRLGGYLLEKFPDLLKVDVHHPDLTLRVEIRLNGIFLSSETIKGAGGLPVGTAGKGMMMLSGGIDSPVAAYLGMKRGVSMEMVHFFSPPYTSPQALAKAKQLTSKLARYSGSIRFIQVPFAEIQETVKEKIPEGYLMTVQRRMMLRLAAAITMKRKGLAIFNGESLGQVASQTMESMLVINDVTNLPVLRPVLSYDKTEIIDVAKKIDTYDLSILPYEDCCTVFTPPSPKTKPNLMKTRKYEERLDIDGLIKRALDGIEITEIHSGEDFLNQNEDVFAELL